MSAERIAQDKVVYVTYEIRNALGEVLERSDLPVGFVYGARSGLFEKVAKSLQGRAVGETVEVTLTPAESFGEHDPGLTFTDDLANVPPEFRHIGAEASFANEKGETVTMTVRRIENEKLTLDGNHPFAGMTVTYRVTVTAVRDATPEEITDGRPAEAVLQ